MKKLLWLFSFFGFIKQIITPAMETVDLIKKAIKSPEQKFSELLFEQYPEGNAHEAAMEQVIEAIRTTLGPNSKCLKKEGSAEIVDCFVNELRTMRRVVRNAILRDLVRQISAAAGGDSKFSRLAEHEQNAIVEVAYGKYKEVSHS